MTQKKNGGSVFAFVLVILIIIGVTLVKLFSVEPVDFQQTNFTPYIARVYVKGTIETENDEYSQAWLLNTIETLAEDQFNVGMILDIDSPGGSVYETDEVYLKLNEYRLSKPIYTYVESMAASGGYYMACATDYIVANRNSLTGCIGVIFGESIDITGLLEKYGVKTKIFHSGRNKVMGSYLEPLTKEQEEIFQSICDECYDQFVSIVEKGRNLSPSKTRELSDGRLYTAKQALQNHLIDQIGSLDDVKKSMEKRFFDNEDLDVVDFSYAPEFNFLDSLGSGFDFLSGKAKSTPLEGIPESLIQSLKVVSKGPAYIYTGL